MISQGAEAVGPCSQCARLVPHDVAEWLVGCRLHWTVSLRCAACGNATEEMGWDESPDLLRQALVDTHGWSRVVLAPPTSKAVTIMMVLRQQRSGMTLVDARRGARQLLAGERRGTRVELEVLAERLRAAGVAAEVVAT